MAAALIGLPLPKGNRVGILTGGGGFGCVTSDACERLGLNVAPLSPQTIENLNAVLPARWPHANPVDTVAAVYPTTYPCLWPLIEDDNLDAVLPVGGIGGMGGMPPRAMLADVPPALRAQTEQMLKEQEQAFGAREEEELKNLDKLIDYMDRYQKTVIIYGRINEDMKGSRVFNKLRENNIPMYPTPERAARVLAHLVEYSRYLNES